MRSFLGRICLLRIVRMEARGAILEAPGSRGEPSVPVLLPTAELPAGARPGQKLEVFFYLDSDDRPVATTRSPAVVVGEAAFLRVVDSTPFGAFVDWGLPKDLLVPFKEQVRPMNMGELHPVALYIDDTGRLAGTTRVGDFLKAGGDFAVDEWVEGVVWRVEPEIGTFVILEREYLALLPPTEFHRLEPGAPARFRVSFIQPDGKIEVSLRGLAYQELEADAERLFDVLAGANAPRLGDDSDPQLIRELLGVSKKAFKRAAGRLLKRGVVEVDADGYLRVRQAVGGVAASAGAPVSGVAASGAGVTAGAPPASGPSAGPAGPSSNRPAKPGGAGGAKIGKAGGSGGGKGGKPRGGAGGRTTNP